MSSSTTEYRRYHASLPEGYDSETPFLHQAPPEGWTASTATGPLREFSLVFVVDVKARKVLLGKKRRGVGVGLYNGFGGKPEKGETIRECAKRELTEESLLVPVDSAFWRVGQFELSRPKYGGREVFRIVVFGCTAWEGEAGETDEMTPEWFDIPSKTQWGPPDNGITPSYPLHSMWPEARIFHEPILTEILRIGSTTGREERTNGYPLDQMPVSAKVVHAPIVHQILDRGTDRELIAHLHNDYVDPATVPSWTLIRRNHSNDPMLEEKIQEALTGWCLAWRSRPADS